MRMSFLRAGRGPIGSLARRSRRSHSRLRLEQLEERLALTAGLPVAVNDFFSTGLDQALELAGPGVLANDSSASGALSAGLFSGPRHGSLELREDGGLTYVPQPGFSGLDSFLYFAADGPQQSLLAAVTIRVEGPAPTPLAVDDVYTLAEDGSLDLGASDGVLANDQFLGSGAIAELVEQPIHGTLTLHENGGLHYQPAADFSGTDTFVYEAVTASGLRSRASVTLHVTPVNDPPVAVNDQFSTSAGTPLVIAAEQGLLANDSDLEGDPLTVELVTGPEHGTLDWLPDGSVHYTPQPGFAGQDGFSYRVSDGTDTSRVAAATILVTPVPTAPNSLPAAVNDELATDEDQPLVLSAPGVLANDHDADGDPLSAVLVNPPRFGTLALAPDGSLVYTPSADFSGVDGFSYLAGDGQGTSAAAGVTIVVRPLADAPRPADDAYVATAGVPLVVEAAHGVLANDQDPDGDSLSLGLVDGPAHGTLQLADDGSFVYTPQEGFHGPDQFIYQVSDGSQEVTATVRIEVTAPQNQRPEAVNDQYTLRAGSTLQIGPEEGLLGNDLDPEGQPLTVSLFAPPLHGELDWSPDGTFRYTPAADFTGVDAFLYRVSDGQEDSALAAVTLYVLPPALDSSAATFAGDAQAGEAPGPESATSLAAPDEGERHCPTGGLAATSSQELSEMLSEEEDRGASFAAAVDTLLGAGLLQV